MPDAPLAARDCAAFGWAVRDAPPRMAYREQSRGACVLLTSGRHERCIHQQATAECRLQRSKRKPCRGERGNRSNRVAVRDPLRSDPPRAPGERHPPDEPDPRGAFSERRSVRCSLRAEQPSGRGWVSWARRTAVRSRTGRSAAAPRRSRWHHVAPAQRYKRQVVSVKRSA